MLGTAAFGVALTLAVCGSLITFASLSAIQRYCYDNEGASGLTNCPTYLTIYWVVAALQAFLLICVGVVAATRSINTFRSTLYTQGAVVVALSIVQGSIAYRFTGILKNGPSSVAYDRWCGFLAGVSICIAADLLLAFVGDALYQERRIQGAKGFVTFKKRLPANWQAKADAAQQEAEAAEGDAAAAGPLRLAFLAALALSVVGACVALGGTAAVQSFCDANGYLIYGSGFQWKPCAQYWSLWWFTWSLSVAFLAATALCFAKKAIHTYRATLWSLAAVTCALSCYLLFQLYSPLDYTSGTLKTRYQATLAGFAIYTGATLVLIVVGDMMYRCKRVMGDDGFVTFKRPAMWNEQGEEPAAPAGPKPPRRPVEWAFFASAALALAGTCVALGGLASAQATCSEGGQQRNFMGIQEDCGSFLSWPWFGWALQVVVLASLAWAWATANVHNYKLSIWAAASVVIFTSCYTANKLFTMQPYSTGALHDRQVAALWGFAIVTFADYLMAITLDAVHQLKREEGADGFITFKRPAWPQRPVAPAPEAAPV